MKGGCVPIAVALPLDEVGRGAHVSCPLWGWEGAKHIVFPLDLFQIILFRAEEDYTLGLRGDFFKG